MKGHSLPRAGPRIARFSLAHITDLSCCEVENASQVLVQMLGAQQKKIIEKWKRKERDKGFCTDKYEREICY